MNSAESRSKGSSNLEFDPYWNSNRMDQSLGRATSVQHVSPLTETPPLREGGYACDHQYHPYSQLRRQPAHLGLRSFQQRLDTACGCLTPFLECLTPSLLLSLPISSILVTRTSSAFLPTETSMSKNRIWAHPVCVGSCGLWGLTFVWSYLGYWFGLTYTFLRVPTMVSCWLAYLVDDCKV